jgi:preprotein translocase subunit SecE
VNWYRKIVKFLSEVWVELKKTSWPSRKEVYGTTLVVIITTLICSGFLYVVDMILVRVMNFILEGFGK